jgi:hypothetical protein
MKFPALATLALIAGPAAAEVYFKEQFNDDVSLEGSDVSDCALRPKAGVRAKVLHTTK